jgi:4-hydroxybenzoyl-CoA thioesterase
MASSSAFVVQVRVRWGDCDPAGIVFYPRFFEWMDISSDDLHRLLGIRRGGQPVPLMRGIPLVDVQAQFLAPAFVDDVLEVRSWIVHVGRTSIALRHEFVRLGDNVTLATGREHRVYVVRDTETAELTPQALTAEMRALLEPHLERGVDPKTSSAASG